MASCALLIMYDKSAFLAFEPFKPALSIYLRYFRSHHHEKQIFGYHDHHVLPRCFGGRDFDNIAHLSPQQHLRAHELLHNVFPDHVGMYDSIRLLKEHRKVVKSAPKINISLITTPEILKACIKEVLPKPQKQILHPVLIDHPESKITKPNKNNKRASIIRNLYASPDGLQKCMFDIRNKPAGWQKIYYHPEYKGWLWATNPC